MSKLPTEIAEVDLQDCLSELEVKCIFNEKEVNVKLLYIPINNGEINIRSFLLYIKKHVFTKYVISVRELNKQYTRKEKLIADEYLFQKALRKISENTAQGKLGELLLYFFIERYLKAPKILSKISLLDDRRTHVKGADAIHAQYNDDELILYLGESKLYNSYWHACKDATESMKTTLESYHEEFDLIETEIDFPNITDELESKIIDMLDPYNDNYSERLRFPCFIGFDDSICELVKSEEAYLEGYRRIAQTRVQTFFQKATQHFEQEQVCLLLLPFKSVSEFTDVFIQMFGVER